MKCKRTLTSKWTTEWLRTYFMESLCSLKLSRNRIMSHRAKRRHTCLPIFNSHCNLHVLLQFSCPSRKKEANMAI